MHNQIFLANKCLEKSRHFFIMPQRSGFYKFHNCLEKSRQKQTQTYDREVVKTQKVEVKTMAAETKTDVNATDNQQQNINPNPQDNPDNRTEESDKPEVTMESLMEEIARLKTSEQKTKLALDKALKEKGDLTKQYREVLTETQQAKIDKETADEEHRQYVLELEEFKKKTLAKERYLMQDMPVDMAEKAAEAEVSGDMDALANIQKQFRETSLKNARAEWQKSTPQPQFGTGEYSSMTKEEILAIKDRTERRKAMSQNWHLFEQKGRN